MEQYFRELSLVLQNEYYSHFGKYRTWPELGHAFFVSKPYFPMLNFVFYLAKISKLRIEQGGQPVKGRVFANLIASLIDCCSTAIVMSLVLGIPITALNYANDLVLILVAWLLIHCFPFEIFFKLTQTQPMRFLMAICSETRRAHKLKGAMELARKHLHSNAVVGVPIVGMLGGSGGLFIQPLIHGLVGIDTSYTKAFSNGANSLKTSLYAAVALQLTAQDFLPYSVPTVMLVVVGSFIALSLSPLLQGPAYLLRPLESAVEELALGPNARRAAREVRSTVAHKQRAKQD
eukprot:Colp12_sorted_trinity150504_noHs@31458